MSFRFKFVFIFLIVLGLAVIGCDDGDDLPQAVTPTQKTEKPSDKTDTVVTVDRQLKSKVLTNQAAYLPPQCYTRTVKKTGEVYNPCYTCHTRGLRPDFTNDRELQTQYSFPAYAEQNRWTNLFKDRKSEIASITDNEILSYIRTSNYFDAEGKIILASKLSKLPSEWDYDEDGVWTGYVPDCYFNFDESGFDRDPTGYYTGWRAFAYYPFPTVHWPANGDYADVLIRLPKHFQTYNGRFDLETYRINLAIIESLIKQRDVMISIVDETRYQVDLNKDGKIGTTDRIVFDWAPNENRSMAYVGDAGALLKNGTIHIAAGLFPEGTEFLNTIRYVGISDTRNIQMAERFKEIRYSRKFKWLTYAELENLALNDVKERDDFPDRLKMPIGNMETGVSNGIGWALQGFIEDSKGNLRPQTFEETVSCIGCHGGIGATTDSTFAFARKLDSSAFQNGWYHWSQKDIKGLNEPKVEFQNAGVQYEYAFYLMYAGAGDEFRSNDEIKNAFFDEHGVLKKDMAQKLHEDISILLFPSAQRALALNKVYKRIVEEQSFIFGRNPLIGKAEEVYETLLASDFFTKVEQPLVLTAHSRVQTCNPCVSVLSRPALPEMQAVIRGNGMNGPDGERYQIDSKGFIDESTYAVNTKGVYFPFPPRHTLPTRMIVPLGSISACYECHRLDRPVPPQNPKVSVPVSFSASDAEEPQLELIRLTDHEGKDVNGTWSPDGLQIAWETDRSGSFQIWIMNSDGSNQRALTHGPAIHGWHSWSPDGTRLAYWGYDPERGKHSISVCAIDGSNRKVIVESDEALDRPVWHPKGEYLAWAAQTQGNWDIWVGNADGTQIYRLTYDSQMESNPLWRPDGNYIAYKVAPNKAYNLTVENFLYVENGFDAPTVRVWDGKKSIQMSDWSPDGKKIAYTAEIVTNASGEDRVTYLAVVEDVSFHQTKISGTPIILSAYNTLGDRSPVFSPDGRHVAFWAWDKSYRATLWIASSDGTNLKQITHLGPDMTPKWHPDGKRLVFESARNGNFDIWSVVVFP